MREPSHNRPPRIRPGWAAEEVDLPAPPAPPRREPLAWLQLLLPLAGAAVFALAGSLSGFGGGWLLALPSGALALLSAGAALHQHRAEARRAAAAHAERRALYEDQLEAQRGRLRRLYEQERAARLQLSPEPAELLAIAGAAPYEGPPEPRLWERRPADDDFLELRVGSGGLPASSRARVPAPPPDAPVDRRLYRIAADYADLRQVPICLPLAQLGSLAVAGQRAVALPLLHAMIWQASVLHAPADLRIAVAFPPAARADWEWLRWLPHALPLSNDPAHSARMCAGDGETADRLLGGLLDELGRRRERRSRPAEAATAEPWILLLIDGGELAGAHRAVAEIMRQGAGLRMAAVVLVPAYQHAPEACAAVLEAHERGARWARAGAPWPRERFAPDRADPALSDRLARRLAGVRLAEAGASQDVPRSVRLFDLLGLADEGDLTPPRFWDAPPAGAWRPDVPIGALGEGRPLLLNLGEGAHGPHGIVAGATGAGKSVLLQGVIAALAVTHGPERLQILLVDFKGGAALSMFAGLAHSAGLVTDLEGRMAERAIVAIKSELRRRKAVLKQTAAEHGGKVEHLGDYRALAARHGLPPLPNLLIVVDEFDELARGYPEFVGELVRVVKQGRSLGVHLLLATQQPARAVTDEIRSQLSFFIALRLGGADDSREMLLRPDAAFLPADTPGRAYIRAGGEVRLFQVAQVTGEHRAPALAPAGPRVSFLGAAPAPAQPQPPAGPRPTDLDVLVGALGRAGEERLQRLGWRPTPIWRQPLPARVALAALPGGPGAWPRPPLGLLDMPQESRQEPLSIDFGAAHLAVVGAPGSGKTTLLRSLALAAAASTSPDELWLYLIDAGGHGLSPLAGLPHVGALIQARERERVRRLVRLLDGAIRRRQDRFRAAGAADLDGYRALTGEPLPALLVIVDKIAVLSEELRDLRGEGIADDLARIARVGRPFGVHLAISADRAADLTYRLLGLLEARVAMRLPELHDYADLLGARVSAQLPADRPGRALWSHPDHGPLELQVALPALAGATDAVETGPVGAPAREGDLLADLRASVAAVAERWAGSPARPDPVELLPERVRLSELAQPEGAGLRATIGREGSQLGAATLELSDETPHALILGPRRSGKTTALRAAALALAGRLGPDELELLILDGPRGGLGDLAALPHATLFAADDGGAAALAAALATPSATEGRRRLLLIDDYQLCRDRLREQLGPSYGEPNLLDLLCELAQGGARQRAHLLAAAGTAYPDDPLLRALDAARSGLILWPGRYDGGTRLLGVSLPPADQRDAEQPPGRALLVREDEQLLIQVANS